LEDLTVKVAVSPGTYEVKLLEADMGRWGTRIARSRILFEAQTVTQKRELGSVGVDSASLAVVDPLYISQEWVVVGPQRDGSIVGADKERIAELLEKNGFRLGQRDEWSIALMDPVNEEAEKQAEKLIDSSGLRGMLLIYTGNTFDQLVDVMNKTGRWGTLPFANGKQGFVVAFETGIGDGDYPVYGLYNGNKLVGIELDFE
jgi:hypothetical protein